MPVVLTARSLQCAKRSLIVRLEERTAPDEWKRVLQELDERPLAEATLYQRIPAEGVPV